jgi:hypothetical protein
VLGYWIDLESEWGRHFELLSLALFATMGWVYAEVIRDRPEPPPPSPVPQSIG